MNYTLEQARKDFKTNGFKLKLTTYSEFKFAEIIHIKSNKSVYDIIGNYEDWKNIDKLRIKFKSKTFDGLKRIVIENRQIGQLEQTS